MPPPIEHSFTTHDGTALAYRAWLPSTPAPAPANALLLFHRGHEHAGRWQETVDALALQNTALFAWDQRGHGNSPGTRGDAQNVATLARDAEFFSRHITQTYNIPTGNTALLAHSVGAVIAAAWVHDYAPPIRGMVLAAPALAVRLYVPFAIPALRAKQKVFGNGFVKSYVKAHMLTHDPEQAATYNADEKIFRQISIRLLLDLHDTGIRLVADAGAITAPTLILAAGKDWVVDNRAQVQFYERLSSPTKQFHFLPNFYHGLFHEKDRAQLITPIRTFLQNCFATRPSRCQLAHADQGGYTRTEYDKLRLPSGIKWKLQRTFLKTLGTLGDGIRLGHQAGFDSGVMLDYVYENKPRGTTPLGKLIDKNYLNAIGWRGIRIRRSHLEQLLKSTITQLQNDGKRIHILDIAAGPGRYVLQTLADLREIPATALLRDYQEVNLTAAKNLAEKLNLSQHVQFQQADAFNTASLAAVSPKPTIAIVSGLYELFPENAPLRASLAGLAAAVEAGGYLIYTCQPWHPQVELIARTLTNREGQPWIMRRRTQGEMDELVRQAGFAKVEQLVDPWGIFTVSLARRA